MPEPPPTRFLIAGDHVGGLRDVIAAARPDLELRAKPTSAIEPADLAWAHGYIGFRRPRSPDWGAVRWIHSIGAGVDGLILDRPLPPGILLTKTSEDFGPAIAEWCLTRVLAVNQNLSALERAQRDRFWDREREPTLLRGQRVLVLGTGSVGRGVASAFRALGCFVTGLSRSGSVVPRFDAVAPVDRFIELVKDADWLILAAPLTAATRHFLDRDRLAQCDGVYLLNVGRGALIDETALPEALDRGWIRGAALDVFAQEPLPVDSPLWHHPNVSISPHISGPSTLAATAEGFLECLSAVERGDRPRLAVDPARGY
jgi:phosphoglycerate dehydrogenase-like enzyme